MNTQRKKTQRTLSLHTVRECSEKTPREYTQRKFREHENSQRTFREHAENFQTYLKFVIFFTPTHFEACKFYTQDKSA